MNVKELEPYFLRIGFRNPPDVSLETLRELQLCHTQSIAFENLNPLLRLPVSIDITSIIRKMVESQRGGYCFEQNHLLRYALEKIGFTVQGLAARVLWNLPEDSVTARGHMLLLVRLGEERYIVDAGFGGLTLTGPLNLKLDITQKTPHESFRIVQPDRDYILQAYIKDDWKPVYRFTLEEQYTPDYEVSNWYLSNNPTSHFVTSLIVTRPAPGVRNVIRNHQFTRHYLDGRTAKEEIGSVAQLKEILKETFFIEVPHGPGIDQILGKLIPDQIA